MTLRLAAPAVSDVAREGGVVSGTRGKTVRVPAFQSQSYVKLYIEATRRLRGDSPTACTHNSRSCRRRSTSVLEKPELIA